MGAEELKRTIKALAERARKGRESSQPSGIDVSPGCAFGAVVGERLRAMEQNLGELKTRLNGLIFVVMGAVVVDIILRLV